MTEARLLPLILILFCLAPIIGCRAPEPAPQPKPVVTVHKVGPYRGDPGVRYSADIKPYTQVNLAFRVGGYIEDILTVPDDTGRTRLIQEGDKVRAGAVMARLRPTEYAATVSQARAGLAEAEASYAQSGLDLERIEKLYALDSVSKSEFDTAATKMRLAQAKVESSKAVVRQAEINLADCDLKVPADTTVISRNIEIGSLVGAGGVGFILADTTRLKAVFGVPDVRLGALKLGDELAIRTEAWPDEEFKGKITRVSPSADTKSRVFDVEVTLDNPRDRLKIGMIASLTVPERHTDGPVLVVPVGAVIRAGSGDDAYGVMIVDRVGEDGTARLRRIGIGKAYGNMIAVTEGLKEGELVIPGGASLIADGEAVRIAP